VVDEFTALLPAGAWPAWMLGDHDISRVATRYDEGGNGQARARVAAMMLLTLRGTPFVYMGDEIGQADGEVLPDRVVDVDGRDPERIPMQWDGSPGAGFTTGDPWLPVGSQAASVNVAGQRDDPASMLSLFRRLIWYRKGSLALSGGDYRSLPDVPGGCYAYVRTTTDERLLVVLNFTGEALEYQVEEQDRGRLELSTDPSRATGEELSLRPLRLGPDEGLVVRLA
jgi:alpha-glucosidase